MTTTKSDRVVNVILSGIGFMNRIREVTPPNGAPYLACEMNLQHGVGKNTEDVRLNCNVKGSRANQIIRKHFTDASGTVTTPKAPVKATVTCGGLKADTFVYKQGRRKGETGVSLRSSLLTIQWLKIGNEIVELESDGDHGDRTENATSQPAQPSTDGKPAFAEMRDEYKRNGCIALSKDHPEFEERKEFLRDNDFRWDRKKSVWVKKHQADDLSAPQEQSAAPAGPRTQRPGELYVGGHISF